MKATLPYSLKIASFYSLDEKPPAFIVLQIEDDKVFLVEIWKQRNAGEGLFTALLRVIPDTCLFNGVSVDGELYSAWHESAKIKEIKNPVIAKPLEVNAGLEVLRNMQAENIFIVPDTLVQNYALSVQGFSISVPGLHSGLSRACSRAGDF